MKNILYISLIFLLLLSSSCKKKEEEDPNNNTPNPTEVLNGLFWQFTHRYKGGSFILNDDYSDDFGNKIRFTRATFYISKPKLYTATGNIVPTLNEYFIVHHNTSTAFIDSINTATTIDSLSLNIGIDADQNHNDPSLSELNDPLAFQSPSMHWGWTNGYLFMVIEGNVDTDGDDLLDDTFAFHIGLDSYLSEVNSEKGLALSADNTNRTYINATVNYDLLFTGIDLSIDNSTHTMDNTDLADRFSANFPSAFQFK